MSRVFLFASLVLAALVVMSRCSLASDDALALEPQRTPIGDMCAISSSCRRFSPTSTKPWPAPRTLDASWIPERWCTHASCAKSRPYEPYTAVLNNVVLGRSGVVFDDSHVYADPLVVNSESWAFPTDFGELEGIERHEMKHIKKAAHFITRFSQNYYHFLVESLPRLLLLKDALAADPSMRIITHSNPFAIQALQRLGYGDRLVETGAETFDEVQQHELFAVDELHYASGFSMYNPNQAVLEQARQALGVRVLPQSERTKVIYVPRLGGNQRQVEDEEELFAAIVKMFPNEEIVRFEVGTLESAIQLFEQAKMVIGVHGAGLTNMLFAAPGTKVVEIMFSSEPITLYWRLASELELEYWTLPVPMSSWKSSLKVPTVELVELVGRALGVSAPVDPAADSCKPGQFASQVTGACVRCSAGFVAAGDHCRICPAGTFSNVRGSACVPCGRGTDTLVWDVTYEPRFDRVLMRFLGASGRETCVTPSRAPRAATLCLATGYDYGKFHAFGRVLGDGQVVATIPASAAVTPTVPNLLLYKSVPLNETHVFVITNDDTHNMVIGGVVITPHGGNANAFTVVRQPDTVVVPGGTTTLAIQYAPTGPSVIAGGGDKATVRVSVCSGFSERFVFRVRGTTVTIPLTLTNDKYTMDWTQTLNITAAAGLLANDQSFQGPLTVASNTAPVSVVVPTPGVSARSIQATSLTVRPDGSFSLSVDPFFSGFVTFTYTATNAFTSAVGSVNVTVNPVSSAIVCPANITINAPIGLNSTPIAWESANASYGAVVVQTAGPSIGSVFSYWMGAVQITYVARAAPGVLSTSCSFFITVGVAPPMISCPAPITVSSSKCSTAVTFSKATATGNTVVVTQNINSGASLPIGVTRVTFTATDLVGQTAQCDLIVTVKLTQARYQYDQLSGYPDMDHDGYGAQGSSCIDATRDKSNTDPSLVYLSPNQLLSANNLDCDDENPHVNPGANEICDGLDNNCNGLIDEGRNCEAFAAELPVEAAPVVLRPVEGAQSLPSLPPTIVTVQRPFTIPVYSATASAIVPCLLATLCVMFAALLL